MIEFLIELLSQVLGEILLDAFLDRVAWEGGRSTIVAGIGHAFAGVLLGTGSLAVFPHHLIGSPHARVLVLLAMPLALGAIFAVRETQGYRPNPRPGHRFVTAAALAIGFGLVRYLFATFRSI